MSAQHAFDELIREYVVPLMRERGYKKSRLSWHRRQEGDWLVLNVQKSAFNDERDVEFMVNLGIGLTDRRGGGFDWPDGKRPPVNRCQHHVRLETIMHRGKSWRVTPRSNVDRTGRELRKAVVEVGLPWLEEEGRDEANRAVDRREEARRKQENG